MGGYVGGEQVGFQCSSSEPSRNLAAPSAKAPAPSARADGTEDVAPIGAWEYFERIVFSQTRNDTRHRVAGDDVPLS